MSDKEEKTSEKITMETVREQLEKYRKPMDRMYWIFLVFILLYNCLSSTPLISFFTYLLQNAFSGMDPTLQDLLINDIYGLRYLIIIPALYTLIMDVKERKKLIIMVGMLILGWFYALYWRDQNDMLIFEIMLLLVASYQKDFKKIARISMVIASSVMILAFILWAVGFLPDYTIMRGDMVRHSFGTIYCTDLAAHWCFIILTYIFVNDGKIKWYAWAIIAGLMIFNALFLGGRMSLICVALALTGSIVKVLMEKHAFRLQDTVAQIWKYVMLISYVVLAAFYLILNFTYSDSPKWFYNSIGFLRSLGGRLNTSWRVTQVFPVSAFGNYFIQIGDGFEAREKLGFYTFLDCSYIRVYVMYGVIAFVAAIAVFTAIQYRLMKKNRLFWMFIMAIVALNCFIEHHMLDTGYNIFILLLFASLPGEDTGKTSDIADKDVTDKNVTGEAADE